jgi:hypothetical protein
VVVKIFWRYRFCRGGGEDFPGIYIFSLSSTFSKEKRFLQLISRNFGHASCEIGWEFGNYKHKIIKLIGNRPIKFVSFASNYRNSL